MNWFHEQVLSVEPLEWRGGGFDKLGYPKIKTINFAAEKFQIAKNVTYSTDAKVPETKFSLWAMKLSVNFLDFGLFPKFIIHDL